MSERVPDGAAPRGDKEIRGGAYTLAPVPIKAVDYMKGFEIIGSLPGPERAAILEQNQRMLEILERFQAWYYPVGRHGKDLKGILWQVKFPRDSRWKDGKPCPGALAAVHDAYTLNKRFAGYNVQALKLSTSGDMVLDTDKILDKALRFKRNEEAHVQEETRKIITDLRGKA